MNNKGLGSAMAGSTMGTTGRERHPSDFYATPADITRSLLLSPWRPPLEETIWECACGTDAMADAQRQAGYQVIATDIDTGHDFMKQESLLAPSIMTNPPFKHATEFIEKAYDLRADYLALLLKMTFWSAASRLDLFRRCQPVAVLPLTWRMDATGQGAPTMDCAWYVWYPTTRPTATRFEPLVRPGK